MRKGTFFAIVSIMLAMLLFACGGGGSSSSGSTLKTLESIAVTPANLIVPVGVAKQFTATGTYSDGTSQDITTQVTWTSSNTSAATIINTGLATAISPGSVTIAATSGGISDSKTLTATAATFSSIGGQVSLAWDPPDISTDVAGYMIHYGMTSGNYTQGVDVGNVTSYTVNNLTDGQTYYFTVVSYSVDKYQSAYSNEVSRTIPL